MKSDEIEPSRVEKNGNTNHSSQPTQKLRHCFTWNNYQKDDIRVLESKFKGLCTKFIFQEEIGEQGTPHIQGAIWLKKKMRFTQFKLPKQINWSFMRNEEASWNYCQKEDTKITDGICIKWEWLNSIVVIDCFKKWQSQILEIIEQPVNKRTVHWFWEPIGGVGKSDLCKYLVVKKDACFISSGKKGDIAYSLAKRLESGKEINIVICDLPRESCGHLSYGCFEDIKNGLIFSSKYESDVLVFNSPHLIILANWEPDFEQMSEDRWNIVRIEQDDTVEKTNSPQKELPHYVRVPLLLPVFFSSLQRFGLLEYN
ncbi:replication associated protein [Miresoil virus 141]|uniref:Replication associated protein n=1 Tax=Miresoil virus 141 TaxID=2911453 RepID=A0A9E8YVX7_9VIRU|nr:replication associated protein [Miresoil virus 141]